MKKIFLVTGILLVILVLTGVGYNLYKTSKTGDSTASTEPNTVTISTFKFSPNELAIKKDQIVTWTDGDSVSHTVTANDGSFESGNLFRGKTFQFTFNQTGTFFYHCSIHPSMTGKIIVQ